MSGPSSLARAPRQLRVGVSIFIRKGFQSVWENGIYQNCIFLVMLLMQSPLVGDVYLVAGGGGGRASDSKDFLIDSPVPIIDMDEAPSHLDVMIEMSAQLDRDWIVGFREQGGKVVSMRVGNDYVIDIERMVFDRPHALLISGAPYDAVWTLQEYERTCVRYFSSTFRAPVRIVPHLWSPVILEREASSLPASQRFGYQPGRARWRVGIFEPNICMVKTSFIPMLTCEAVHRVDSEILEHIWVYNTLGLKDQAAFTEFASSLDIVKHGLASFEGRFPLCQVVAKDVDVLVTHQWENAQNYVYYEALYGAYPLIHNSAMIGACGYRYHDFDCEEGGSALRHAFSVHDADLDHYKETARAFLAALDPSSEENIREYGDALSTLYARHG